MRLLWWLFCGVLLAVFLLGPAPEILALVKAVIAADRHAGFCFGLAILAVLVISARMLLEDLHHGH
jgi:threonine/homoserine/homoserine lactone efflux protein